MNKMNLNLDRVGSFSRLFRSDQADQPLALVPDYPDNPTLVELKLHRKMACNYTLFHLTALLQPRQTPMILSAQPICL